MKHHQGMMMAKQLNLTAEQQKQAKMYREDLKQKMQALNKNESITVKEFRDRRAAMHKEMKLKMEGILTAEQKAKMAQMKAERMAKKEEHFNKHLEKMKGDLSLTEQQVTQMKAQRESMRSKMKALRENDALTRVQKREQMMSLKEQAMEQHKKIFTPDQMKKMDEMKSRHMEGMQEKMNKPVKPTE